MPLIGRLAAATFGPIGSNFLNFSLRFCTALLRVVSGCGLRWTLEAQKSHQLTSRPSGHAPGVASRGSRASGFCRDSKPANSAQRAAACCRVATSAVLHSPHPVRDSVFPDPREMGMGMGMAMPAASPPRCDSRMSQGGGAPPGFGVLWSEHPAVGAGSKMQNCRPTEETVKGASTGCPTTIQRDTAMEYSVLVLERHAPTNRKCAGRAGPCVSAPWEGTRCGTAVSHSCRSPCALLSLSLSRDVDGG